MDRIIRADFHFYLIFGFSGVCPKCSGPEHCIVGTRHLYQCNACRRQTSLIDEDVPTMAQVLRMATVGGAKTTPFGSTIGTLEVGKAADCVLIDWKQVSYPYLDTETPLIDAVIQRAKTEGVKMTTCAGEVLYKDGKFTKVDKDAALKALHDDQQKALTHDEVEQRNLSKKLLPHVRQFYANYMDPSKHEPFYRPSSRV